MSTRSLLWLGVAGSVSLHLVVSWALPDAGTGAPTSAHRPAFVKVTATDPKPRLTPERPAPPPNPPPAVPRARPKAPPPLPVAEPQPAADPIPPASLAGSTLTSEGGSFAMPQGDGTERTEPLAPPPPVPAPSATIVTRSAPAAVAPRPVAPAQVPAANLSRRPEPPALDDTLQRFYPPEAKAAGRAGMAVLRLLIEPDGRASVLGTAQSTDEDFAAACRRSVEGSRWTAPLGPDGQAVRTQVLYRCRFRVSR